MRKLKIILVVIFLLSASRSHAGTVLDFWHSYVHAKTHQTHYSFHLARYKRGLFWGSCGPSTKSQQWSFIMDLAGNGPVYSSQEIAISDDNGGAVIVVSGRVVTDLKRMRAKIDLEVENDGSTKKFIGNGEYKIEKLK
jgi:hypothetical protein